jgi:tetratricopeptide (TPR) repeat protein
MKNILRLVSVVVLEIALIAGCELDLAPYDSLTVESLSLSEQGIESLANGCLMMMKENLSYSQGQEPDPRDRYVRHLNQLTEFPSDDVMIVKSTTDNLWYSFNMQHIPGQLNTTYFWFIGYKIILNANNIIEGVDLNESTSARVKHLLGEAYYYRAMVHFDMARVFSTPPSNGLDKPGIIIRKGTSEEDNKARATVGETYNQIISDLRKAASLMTTRESNHSEAIKYASKWSALALLSRAFLYMEQWDSAVSYANKLIPGNPDYDSQSPFELESRENYVNSFWNATTSSEAIFIFYFTDEEEHGEASIGSMYNAGPTGTEGWGEIFPSKPFRELLATYRHDVRNDLIDTIFKDDGVTIKNYPNTQYPTFYINKFSNQDGIVPLNSPQYIRLSELYLNRAEAYAHMGGHDQAALDDVNLIRERAGLSGNELVTAGNLASHGYSTVLDAVLGERRLELAFEGFRRDDLLRNKIDLDRSFPSAQNPTDGTDILPWDDPRQIYFIPQAEIINNKSCDQNP